MPITGYVSGCLGSVEIVSPLSIFGADLLGWWKADTDVSTSGGNVTSVLDQSGNDKTLTPVGGNVPFNATGFNGLPAFDFAAANGAGLQNTSFTGLAGNTQGSAFLVGQMKTGTETNGGLVAFLGNTGGDDFNSAGSVAWITRAGTTNAILTTQLNTDLPSASGTAISLATNLRIGSVFDAVNHTHYINNVAGTSTAHTQTWGNTDSNLVIGGRLQGGVFTPTCWDGPIAEIIITKNGATSGQRSALDTYFVNRLGL